MRWFAAGRVAALALAVVPLVSAAPAAGADWEARGAGAARASFAPSTTTTGRGNAARTVRRITDLVVQAPISCTDSPTPTVPIDVEVIPASIAVGGSGSFASGAIRGVAGTTITGIITGRRVTISYRHITRTPNAFDGGTEVCDTRTLSLTGAPGQRPAITATSWQGQTQRNEPVALNIVAGGRALQEPPHIPANGSAQAAVAFGAFTQTCFTGGCSPSSSDICAYETPATFFVAADGSFGNAASVEGDQATFTGRFTSSRAASGTFVNGGEGCEQTSWTASPG